MSKTIVDVNVFIISTASCGPWSYKKRSASRRHSFCRAMFIDMADKQPITAQPNAMLTERLHNKNTFLVVDELD